MYEMMVKCVQRQSVMCDMTVKHVHCLHLLSHSAPYNTVSDIYVRHYTVSEKKVPLYFLP